MTNWACAAFWKQSILGLFHQRPLGVSPCIPPAHITPIPPSAWDQMPTIPCELSQSMLGRTMAGLQPIGSTLLTACNLLISLAGLRTTGVRTGNQGVLYTRLGCSSTISLWKGRACYICIVPLHLLACRDTRRNVVIGICLISHSIFHAHFKQEAVEGLSFRAVAYYLKVFAQDLCHKCSACQRTDILGTGLWMWIQSVEILTSSIVRTDGTVCPAFSIQKLCICFSCNVLSI